jgi:pyruvoyl-dependent arginine decarboxylase (PvlArgDC)
MNAMAALRKLNYFDEKVLSSCINACLSSNGRLAGPATETVKYFYTQMQYKKLINDGVKGMRGQNWEKEILNRLTQ